jgi:membrane protein
MTAAVLGRLIRETYAEWGRNDGWLYAAAMAAFAALALAPLLLIVLHIADVLGGEASTRHGLAVAIDPIAGHGAVRALIDAGAGARNAAKSITTTVVSVTIALFAGSRLFYALQRALHAMWDTPIRRKGNLTTTIVSFLGAGALSVCAITGLTAIVFGSAALSIAARATGTHGVLETVGIHVGLGLLGALILTPVVAALFKWLPGTRLDWSDVWIGALTTTIGFAISQSAIGIYLATVNLPWTYGSAASLIVLLLWLYYSAYLFLLGAEFTHVYAREVGSLRESVTD